MMSVSEHNLPSSADLTPMSPKSDEDVRRLRKIAVRAFPVQPPQAPPAGYDRVHFPGLIPEPNTRVGRLATSAEILFEDVETAE